MSAPARWVAPLLWGLALISLAACVLFASRGGWWLASAPFLAGAVLALGWAQAGPRGGGPPRAAPGGTVLPRRRGHLPGLALGTLSAAVGIPLLGWAGLEADDGSGRRFALLLLLSPPLAVLAGWLLRGWLRGRGGMRLTPDGVEYDALGGRAVAVAWKDVTGVELDNGAGNGVVLAGRRGEAVALPIAGQGLPAATLVRLLRWYARTPRDRAELADPDSVARRLDVLGR